MMLRKYRPEYLFYMEPRAIAKHDRGIADEKSQIPHDNQLS
ncbi:hypothetical protein [Dolichospermum compactum]|nr:hypothetical protein [Dolichospermum compactum]